MSKDQWKKISILEIRPQGKNFIALFEGYEDRETAARLTNLEIGVSREELPPLENGEYYWTDLVGLTVITELGVTLGIVDRLLETGSNDVLVVKGELREHLIPYIPDDYVLEIDLESKIMRVAWDPEF